METPSPRDFSTNRGLASTQWTTIRACVGTGQAADVARETLCRDYWYPIYAYIKRLPYRGCEAEDLTQEFFERILSRPWFEHADPAKGRFRSFLFSSLENFLSDRFDRNQARKRSGRYQHIPFDLGNAESRYAQSAAASVSPAEVYEVAWAGSILDATWNRLEDEYIAADKKHQLAQLKIFLTVTGDASRCDAAAKSLGMSVCHVKVCIHRFRKRFGAILREEVARTVHTPEDMADEIRYIREVFAEKATAAA